MLDINFIHENKEKVEKASADKGVNIDIDKLLKIDEERRKLLTEVQEVNEKRNKLTKEEGMKRGKELKEKLHNLQDKLKKIHKEYNKLMFAIPNLPLPDTKVGKDENYNEILRQEGKPTEFDFKPKDHIELGETLDLIDIKSAAKVSGSRFGYIKNKAVIIEFALVQLALKVLTEEGFTPIIPPVLINKKITEGLGYWQGGGHQDYYLVDEPDEEAGKKFLVGTAEHSIVPLHSDETHDSKSLPKRYVAFSTCFRREAGSYGKDVKGIFRVHQFDKVEMVSFISPEKGKAEHEYLLSLQEKLLKMLEIPYQVVKMCTGDLGFPVAGKYDIEAWFPSQKRYREVTSVSTTTDFQARRLNIKYREGDQKRYVHILNGTAYAIGRTLIALIENHQQKDGSIKIPKALRDYTGFSTI